MEMVEWISDAIYGFFMLVIEKANNAMFEGLFSSLKSFILEPTDPSKYINNFYEILNISRSLAGGIFSVFVVLAVFRQLSGTLYQGDRSVGKYVIDMSMAGLLIYLLPITVTNILLPLNNKLIELLQRIGFTEESFDGVVNEFWLSAGREESFGALLIVFIFFLSFWILVIAGAIRYIETLLIILVAPLFALSLINGSDGIQIWFRESISVIFTQTIHFLMISFIVSSIAGVSNTAASLLLTIGGVAVALKGPQILRQYLYRTGTGSVMVSSAGEVSRLGAMSMIIKK